ncbi:MAG TPA: iron ABC transporter permease, partial [Burkholderiaceae bacterium]|nr:iron ABC transporter permease [Burkholderiaceae bacterium]
MRTEIQTNPADARAPVARRRSAPIESALGRPLLLALVCTALVGLPVLSIFASFVDTAASAETLRHLAATVIPDAMVETFVLGGGVVIGVVILGSATGWIAASCEFPGRRITEWALLLPLAMPAYIVAYAYTDALQFSGPMQSALREGFGWRRGDYWFP